MPFKEIENLKILQEAEEICDPIWNEVINWGYFAKDTGGKQLVKSADSIGANIAESQGRFHLKDVIHFLYISRGSSQEVKFWLRRALKRELIKKEKYDVFTERIDKLIPQINAFISSQRRRKTPTCKLTNQQTD